MERNAVGVETGVAGLAQQLDRHLRGAAEFARQRPFGAVAGDEDPAEDARAGGGASQFFEFVSAVEGKQPHSRLIGPGDILFLLDRVAERQPVGGDRVAEAELDFAAARDIETGALAVEHADDLGGRVRLDRIINPSERQIMPQLLIGFDDHIEVDDEARGLGSLFGKKTGDPLAHD